MSTKTSVVKDETRTEPIVLFENDQVAFQINISGVVSSLASPTQTFYKQNTTTDTSSTYFTGSMTASGTTVILTKTTQNLKAGEWILSVSATVDGQVQNVARIPIIIKRQGDL